MKYLPLLLCLIIIPFLLFSPLAVLAEPTTPAPKLAALKDAVTKLETVGKGVGYKEIKSSGGLPQLVGKIINIFLSVLGVIFVILIIYGGYTWMTAYGDKTKLDKAKDLINNAVIGLIIVLSAYAISSFVVGELIKQTIK